MDETSYELELPGFRFHPTEEELLDFYLKNTVISKKLRYDIIGFINIYRHEPSELPGLRNRKERMVCGYWKATGSDRKIFGLSEPKRVIGFKKTLVFYNGRAPRGSRTDWIMNEYRLPDKISSQGSLKYRLYGCCDVVLCKIYRKATSLKVLEQRAAMEEEMMKKTTTHQELYHSPLLSPSIDAVNSISVDDFEIEDCHVSMMKEKSSSSLQFPASNGALPELEVPKFSMDCSQDPIWTPLRSPWLENILNNFVMFSNSPVAL
ncbi:hypothetical protein Leryth_010761 [Lithospermum erythrorhizon]|nr:hypothetical protein Leryth_010761 [Lithospermum erythrorhizon]